MTPLAIAATRVTSPRHNAALPGDVNGDQLVTARDALAVINDIAQLGNRVLGESERVGLLVDVNDDGIVSVRDALWVINQLARGEEATGEAESTARAVDSGENGGQAQPARIPAAAGTDLDPASQSAPAFQNSSAKNGAGMELGSGTVLDDEQSWGHGGWNRSVDRAIAETSTWESAVDFGDTRQQSDDGGDTADDESAETYDEILTGLHGFGGVYQAFDASSLANRRI
jgi:hypothetical protein